MFTENELEKDPLKEVAAEPFELLDKTRYDFSSKQLPEEREVQLESIMSKLREECTIKGIMVSTLSSSFTREEVIVILELVQRLMFASCFQRKQILPAIRFSLHIKTALPDSTCPHRFARTDKITMCCE